VAAVLVGTGLVVTALSAAPEPPPRPDPAAAPRFGGRAAPGAAVPAAPAGAPSVPARLSVDAIGVTATVQPVGVDADGGVHVPPSGRPGIVGWYSQGPTPGEAGNAVLVGHVDSRTDGPGVFFELGRLEPGDEVAVARADGTRAIFRVDGVTSYRKAAVPAELVFGEADRPGLRLITCGGDWDSARRTYADNVVAFATLVGWSR
jgi:sortase family protein